MESLVDGFVDLIHECEKEVRQYCQKDAVDKNESRVRKEWDDWYDKVAPESDDVEVYLTKIAKQSNAFRNPLGNRNQI